MLNYKISYYLPEKILTNCDLVKEGCSWSEEKILKKTGIQSRHIAFKEEVATDMAYKACTKLFSEYHINIYEIELLIVVTQSSDYIMPTTACILQDRLGLKTSTAAFDINLGCSGYIYALAVTEGFLKSGLTRNALVVTVDTYSKYLSAKDFSTRTIFGDGAAATYIENFNCSKRPEFVLGTDGKGYDKFIIPAGGLKQPQNNDTKKIIKDKYGYVKTLENIHMDGPEILMFSIKKIPQEIERILQKTNMTMDSIDLFVFHQASGVILNMLKEKMKIPDNKFFSNIEIIGNTVSSSIPIALCDAQNKGLIIKGTTVMLVGFGVGLSWGISILEW